MLTHIRHNRFLFLVLGLAIFLSTSAFAAQSINIEPHKSVRALAVSPDGNTFAITNSVDNDLIPSANEGNIGPYCILQLLDIPHEKLLHTEKLGTIVDSLSFSPDGALLACGYYDGVRLWDIKNGKWLWIMGGGLSTTTSIAFAPDGKRLVIGSASDVKNNWGRIVFWTIDTKVPSNMTHARQVVTGGKYNIQSVAYSPDGKTVVSGGWSYSKRISKDNVISGSDYGELRFLDAKSGEVRRLIKTKSEGIKTVAFSPNGKMLATTSINSFHAVVARVRDVTTGHLLHTLSLENTGFAVATFLPDNKTLAIGGPKGKVILWDVLTNKVLNTFFVSKSQINAIAYDAKHNMLVTGSKDGSVRFWAMNNLIFGR